MKTNIDKLVMQSVKGKIHSPIRGSNPYKITSQGEPVILPATGGITYNFQIGDSCMDIVGDHVEPGVSLRNENKEENNSLMVLSCVGNQAIVKTGDAKGAKGFVTGMHGGIEHVLLYFNKSDLENMNIDDEILIKSFGQGLKINNHEDVVCMNIDPNLLSKLGIIEKGNGDLEVPVVTKIPAYLMGSGIGSSTGFTGDYDIMTGDKTANEEFGINELKFGDLVLLQDCDNTYGRQYLKDSVTIGVVVHSNCILSGHGPGITTLLTCKTNKLKGIIDINANIRNYLELE